MPVVLFPFGVRFFDVSPITARCASASHFVFAIIVFLLKFGSYNIRASTGNVRRRVCSDVAMKYSALPLTFFLFPFAKIQLLCAAAGVP